MEGVYAYVGYNSHVVCIALLLSCGEQVKQRFDFSKVLYLTRVWFWYNNIDPRTNIYLSMEISKKNNGPHSVGKRCGTWTQKGVIERKKSKEKGKRMPCGPRTHVTHAWHACEELKPGVQSPFTSVCGNNLIRQSCRGPCRDTLHFLWMRVSALGKAAAVSRM
jgi:hypothetical protein